MAPEKDSNFIAYKFHDLKVFASNEWLADGKKKYRQVFEASELTYVYAEFSFYNKLFDEQSWNVSVTLKCYQIDSVGTLVKEMGTINSEREVKITDNIVFVREGWGSAQMGQYWKKGIYKWVALVNGVQVGEKRFYVESHGPVTQDGNPYFSVSSLRLFEGPYSLPGAGDRKFYTKFDQTESRYIWGELKLNNSFKDELWYCELVYYFYNDARQLKGRTEELITVQKGQETIEICSGWGSETKGTWYNDYYTLEVVFMERLVAVVPFEVGAGFVEGESTPVTALAGVPVVGTAKEEPAGKSLDELLAELDALIGLEGVKKKVREYTQYLRFLKIRQEKGIEEPQRISLHAVLTGNPGTGKTTVAKMLGQIYHKMGLLTKGHVHEVDRAELVGEYIGQTAPKVKEAIKKAAGGILFIDEAYSLARSKDDPKDFGREVIEILLKEMSDGAAGIAVVVAGYPEEMKTFLDSNPGLKSRFNITFEFADYLPQELMQIAKYASNQRKVEFTEEANALLYEKLVEAYRNRDRTFGNARYVNSLVDESKMNMGLRVVQKGDLENLRDEDLKTIHLEDVQKIFGITQRARADIPVDEDLLQRSLAELNHLVGLGSVKSEIQELVKLVKFYRETGKDVMNTFSLHSVFSGNPGTGKTTVARILAKIFKALGILEKGHLVEVDRADLVGGYVGQTALQTTHKLDEARGGVFFIDEAYALSQGGQNDFGKEAVETILKRMEDDRGHFIVIAAGYTDNMKTFLETNPGLKSRFDKAFHFEDYTPMELWEIATQMLKTNGLVADHEAELHLKQYFAHRHQGKDKYFGNARTVRRVVEEVVKNQHLRLAGLPSDARTAEVMQTLTLDDVQEFDPKKDDLMNVKTGKIGFSAGKGANGQGAAGPQSDLPG